jgi:hypothetical protein
MISDLLLLFLLFFALHPFFTLCFFLLPIININPSVREKGEMEFDAKEEGGREMGWNGIQWSAPKEIKSNPPLAVFGFSSSLPLLSSLTNPFLAL